MMLEHDSDNYTPEETAREMYYPWLSILLRNKWQSLSAPVFTIHLPCGYTISMSVSISDRVDD